MCIPIRQQNKAKYDSKSKRWNYYKMFNEKFVRPSYTPCAFWKSFLVELCHHISINRDHIVYVCEIYHVQSKNFISNMFFQSTG